MTDSDIQSVGNWLLPFLPAVALLAMQFVRNNKQAIVVSVALVLVVAVGLVLASPTAEDFRKELATKLNTLSN